MRVRGLRIEAANHAERIPGIQTPPRSGLGIGVLDIETRRSVIEQAIEMHARPGPTGAFHGMSTPESFWAVDFDRQQWHFSDSATKGQMARTIEALLSQRDRQPTRLREATKRVFFTAQHNHDDDYWRSVYPNIRRSGATGGDSDTVVYDLAARPGQLYHEGGHNLAKALYGEITPRGHFAAAASTSERPVSAYGTNALSEDFAEAVAFYVEDPDRMKAEFPARFKVIRRIMKDGRYGG